ncbi:hypothetical protein Tco_0489708 [Tanacetum coccineum]
MISLGLHVEFFVGWKPLLSPQLAVEEVMYVYDNNRLLQWFLFRHSRSSMQVLTDGGVIVLERQESNEKWDTSPSAKNGVGLSSITVGETSTTDQEQRGFCDYMVPDICVNKELEDETLGNLEYERTYKY